MSEFLQACKLSSEEVQTKVEVLQELMSLRVMWAPVEELHRLGGITLLLQIIAFAREWNYSGRRVEQLFTLIK